MKPEYKNHLALSIEFNEHADLDEALEIILSNIKDSWVKMDGHYNDFKYKFDLTSKEKSNEPNYAEIFKTLECNSYSDSDSSYKVHEPTELKAIDFVNLLGNEHSFSMIDGTIYIYNKDMNIVFEIPQHTN